MQHTARTERPVVPQWERAWVEEVQLAAGELTTSAQLVAYSLIAWTDGTTLESWPSVRMIANATGLSGRTVERAMADLIRAGLITRTWRQRRRVTRLGIHPWNR